jgi:prolipoprotein diacylglyceryltransferase
VVLCTLNLKLEKMKNNITTIILFLGALIWFVIFAADYTYHKDFMTWMHLLASITCWTGGMRNCIIKSTKHNGA